MLETDYLGRQNLPCMRFSMTGRHHCCQYYYHYPLLLTTTVSQYCPCRKQPTDTLYMQGRQKTSTHGALCTLPTRTPTRAPIQAGTCGHLPTAPSSCGAQHSHCRSGVTPCKTEAGGRGVTRPCCPLEHAYTWLRTQSRAETHHSQVAVPSCH